MIFRELVENYIELNEGIKWFKESDKINRILSRMMNSATELSYESVSRLSTVFTKLKNLARRFKKVEDEYARAQKNNLKRIKDRARKEYNTLKEEYKEILDLSSNTDIKDALVKAGIAGIFSVFLLSSVAGLFNIDLGKNIFDQGIDLDKIFNPNGTGPHLNTVNIEWKALLWLGAFPMYHGLKKTYEMSSDKKLVEKTVKLVDELKTRGKNEVKPVA